MSTHTAERRRQSRRISDQGIEDLLNTFSTPQCHSCLEHLGGAVLLLGKDREVLHATPSMKTLARKCNALLSLKPRFELLDAQKNAYLSDFFNGAAHMANPFVLHLASETTHSRLLLTCYRLPKTKSDDANIPQFLIKCRMSDPYDTHQWCFFVTQFKLSDAEIKLCRALIDGLTLSECRQRWGVTNNTLKSQLRNIFRKTSVHRQVDLLRLIYLLLQG